ncbi:uncharacterized protein [Dermacentor albipictus]|uniref:uncharacterized protein isoform X1 n=1 Tax=Dermacentor albipictus TaxID=60249 RepID=UPI0031FC99DE
MLYHRTEEGALKQDGFRSATNMPQHFVIRHTTDEPEPPGGHRPPSRVQLPPALFTLPPKATDEVVEGNKKAKEVAKKKKKKNKRRRGHHKPTEVVRDGGTKEGGKEPTVVTHNAELYLGNEDVLPMSLPANPAHEPVTTMKLTKDRPSLVELREEVTEAKEGAKVRNAESLPKPRPAKDSAVPNDPRTLTKLRPSLLALKDAFRKMAPKPKMDMGSRKISVASSMASGPSQAAAAGPPARRSTIASNTKSHDRSRKGQHSTVCVGPDKSGDHSPTSGPASAFNSTGVRSLLKSYTVNMPSGHSLAFCVTALVVLELAFAVVVVILTAILGRMHSKRQAVSSPVTTVASPHLLEAGVGADCHDRNTLPVP